MRTDRLRSFSRIVGRREWKAGIFGFHGGLTELALSCGHTQKIATSKAPKHRIHCLSCEGDTTTHRRRSDRRASRTNRSGDRRSRK